MMTFNAGDLVEATKGETVIRGRAEDYGSLPERLWFKEAARTFDALKGDGFTFRLIEKAPATLPTEPGFYVSEQNEVWRLADYGDMSGWLFLDGDEFLRWDSADVAEYAPLIRLVPEVK